MRVFITCILLFLFASTSSALAADAASDPSLFDAGKAIFDAVMHGQWWAAAALGVIMACAAARKYMPASWKEGTKGDIIGTSMAFVMAFAGAIATWAVAPGAAMSAGVALTALKVGAAAIGGYTAIHKLAQWLMAWGKMPAWMLPILKMVTMIIGSNAVKKAEAAGEAAVKADPAKGMAGDSKIVEVE